MNSVLYKNEIVIDDSYTTPPEIIVNGRHFERGRIARDMSRYPRGFFRRFNVPTIPRDRWEGIIKQQEQDKARLSDIVLYKKIPSKNQAKTNYCWANGVVTAKETVRAKSGLPYIDLSPASVAAIIKNYRNQGGWGGEAIEYMAKHGICSTKYWPANAIDRSYDNENSRRDRKNHIIPDWWELDVRDFDQLMTCVLLGIPVAIGLNWWRHEVCAMDGVNLGNGRFGIRIRNSWGESYGAQGFAVLTESKATPDDAVAPVVVLPTETDVRNFSVAL